MYLSSCEKSIKRIHRKQKQRKAIPQLVKSSDEESEDDLEEDRTIYNAVDCLNRSSRPALTVFKKKLIRSFTFDKQHFKKKSDYNILAICNNIKESQINKIIRKDLGYEQGVKCFRCLLYSLMFSQD